MLSSYSIAPLSLCVAYIHLYLILILNKDDAVVSDCEVSNELVDARFYAILTFECLQRDDMDDNAEQEGEKTLLQVEIHILNTYINKKKKWIK